MSNNQKNLIVGILFTALLAYIQPTLPQPSSYQLLCFVTVGVFIILVMIVTIINRITNLEKTLKANRQNTKRALKAKRI